MPTALELKREGWDAYVREAREHLRKRPRPQIDEAKRAALLERVKRAAAMLKEEFGATSVILVGSLAHGAWFTPESDVDLVVVGIRPEDFWRAWRLVEEIIGDREVDLVDADTLSDTFRDKVEREGIPL